MADSTGVDLLGLPTYITQFNYWVATTCDQYAHTYTSDPRHLVRRIAHSPTLEQNFALPKSPLLDHNRQIVQLSHPPVFMPTDG